MGFQGKLLIHPGQIAPVHGVFTPTAEEVARAGLDGLAKNKAINVPGAVNKVTASFSSLAPRVVTRKVASAVANARD